MTTGVLLETDGTRWRFDAGAPSLDFAATADPDALDRLATPAELGAWLAAREPRVDPGAATDRDLADALAARDALARLVVAAADGSPFSAADVEALNLVAALPDIPPTLPGGSRLAGGTRIRVAQALSTIARDGIRVLIEHADEPRIRRCAAADCGRVFHDGSRTRSRRWCSMERCGNRAKVRAYRARSRAGAELTR